MKKTMLFAAACAVLAACTKNNDTATLRGADSFEKGQRVTLCVGADATTKVTSSLDSGTGAVSFKWEAGDIIKVSVGDASAEFTVSRLIDGGASAEFTGTMPAAGSTFNVQHPYAGVSEAQLASQSFSSTEALPHGMMLATATGCTLSTPFSVVPQYAALRLNLWGNKTIGKIVVTNTSSTASPQPSYTLDCGTGAATGTTAATATPFLIVVPAGTYKFSAAIYDNSSTPAYIRTYSTSAAKTFTAAAISNMPAKEVGGTQTYPGSYDDPITIGGVTWAPVNCGTDASHPYGLLYQWGRKVGQGYKDATYSPDETNPTIATSFTGTNGSEDPDTFYTYGSGSTYSYDWIQSGSNLYWDKSGNAESTGNVTPTKGDFDPCPEGWRVPTYYELKALMGSHTSGALQDGTGFYAGKKGKYFDGSSSAEPTSGVFLPAAGYRNRSGSASNRSSIGFFWSSSVTGSNGRYLSFNGGNAYMSSYNRSSGYSVRCVQE